MLAVTQLCGFGAVAGGAPVVAFTDSAVDPTNTTTYTFTLDFGAAAGDRYLIATPSTRGSGTGAAISSVTIGGVTATEVINTTALLATVYNGAAIFIAAVPTGTSGDVVVTYANSQLRAGCGLYQVTGLSSSTAHDTATDSGSDPLTDTIDVPAGGFIVAVAVGEGTPPIFTWTGVDESYDEAMESTICHSGGFKSYAAAQTGQAIEADISGSPTFHVMSAASFR
jgi:hypothetical protein